MRYLLTYLLAVAVNCSYGQISSIKFDVDTISFRESYIWFGNTLPPKYDTVQGIVEYYALVEGEYHSIIKPAKEVDSVWIVNEEIISPAKMAGCGVLHYGNVERRKLISIISSDGVVMDNRKYYKFIPKSQL